MARKTPKNKNFLSPNGFQLSIARMPNVEFFVQDVEIPGVEGPMVEQANPLVMIGHSPDQLTFENLNIIIALDEEMKSWEELFKWKLGLGFPNQSKEHKDLTESPDGLVSDLSVVIETSHHNGNLVFTFKDAYPVRIGGFTFTSRNTDVPVLEFTATFNYTSFSFDKIVR